MSQKTKKDVVIVGTGIAGSIVAKTLSDHVYHIGLEKMVHRAKVTSKDEPVRELNILMLEAGLKAGVELEAMNAFETYNEYVRTFYDEEAKVPNSPYPNLKQAPSPNVLDIHPINQPFPDKTGYLVQYGPLPFASDAIRVGGGTTMHWLGSTPRMLPNDFKLQEKYGVAKNWPIDYDTLKPYYEMAENEIGISGNVDEQEYPGIENIHEYYGEGYCFPMEKIPQSFMDDEIIEGLKGTSVRLENTEIPLTIIPTPQGRNSIPNPDYNRSKVIHAEKQGSTYQLTFDAPTDEDFRSEGAIWDPYQGERCEGNASCVPICPVQAKYNALKTLKKAMYKKDEDGYLRKHKNIEVRAQSVVYRLTVADDDSKNITKLHLRYYKDASKTSFKEKVIDTSDALVILAANAFENPKIMLNSPYKVEENGEEVEKTVGNGSDQVGRNLMDHLVMLTWGLTPEPVYPYRGPGSTTNISSFRDGSFRDKWSAWISPLDNWGWQWPAFSPGSDLSEFLAEGLFGEDLRQAMGDRLSRQVLFHFEIEQMPCPDNRVTINNEYLDVLGIPRPIVHYNVNEYEMKAMEQAKIASDQMFERLGVEDFTKYRASDNDTVVYNNVRYAFNGAGHIVGTHRMGDTPEDSVTNSYCKSWEHPNLYVVGAGSMTTLGTSNPTLTLSAITIRAVESMLADLDEQFKSKA
ncbi:MAG: GMC family oxidoreductase [Crocinitomicaceae bacterium]